MARPKRSPFVQWKLNIDEDLSTRFDDLFTDPRYNRPVYGFRSRLVSDLLRKYIKDVENGNEDPVKYFM